MRKLKSAERAAAVSLWKKPKVVGAWVMDCSVYVKVRVIPQSDYITGQYQNERVRENLEKARNRITRHHVMGERWHKKEIG